MAVPKKRTSQSKTRMRKAAWFAKAWQKSANTLNVYRQTATLNQKFSKGLQQVKAQGFGKSRKQTP